MDKSFFTALFLLILGNVFSQNELKMKNKSLTVYSTTDNTNQRLTLTDTVNFSKTQTDADVSIFVNPLKTFQTILGIGGAITDASAEIFAKLPAGKQKELLEAYFDTTKGIGYSLVRTHINSCDFSPQSYSYIAEGDKELKTFDIQHDKAFRIPFIKRAMKTANNNLLVYASPWSPPAFMKDNKSMLHGGKLLPEFDQAWANYYVKFINAYQQEGIPIWGFTIQNEPMASQTWESCIYTAEEERDFLKYFLGPTMAKNGLEKKNIVVYDHNRDFINQRANVIFEDSVASSYAWGIGFHWYETWDGGEPMHANVAKVNESYPTKKLLFTEGCVEVFNPQKLYYWGNAERYGRSMINDFNAGTVGYTDWNILLDERGGPNHVGNYCFAPIHADTKTGSLIYTPSYYFIGHFSKFIRPNAKRVSTALNKSQLLAVSFINEDGKMVSVVMNGGDKSLTYNLIINGVCAKILIFPHAIQTLVY